MEGEKDREMEEMEVEKMEKCRYVTDWKKKTNGEIVVWNDRIYGEKDRGME